jgi:hypothetical protein
MKQWVTCVHNHQYMRIKKRENSDMMYTDGEWFLKKKERMI